MLNGDGVAQNYRKDSRASLGRRRHEVLPSQAHPGRLGIAAPPGPTGAGAGAETAAFEPLKAQDSPPPTVPLQGPAPSQLWLLTQARG